MSNKVDHYPWDIRRVTISLGGEDDCNGWMEAEVFSSKDNAASFSLTFKNTCHDSTNDDPDYLLDCVDIRAAVLLRDFLNYALKDFDKATSPD
jgi:hypothetical protein